ncbi:MAG: sigma-70 family RNA polymerase sigma factor [Planctomycetia bacterium]|nr:sigma-70 family RNA polymerase sigma factor [Planctomycetia bacterium]
MYERARVMQPDLDWAGFVSQLQSLDAYLVMACLERQEAAWDNLFQSKVGRADRLLLDALRSRAARLYPRMELEQETAINDFWGHLIVSSSEESLPILARYDGLRPLVPWLLRVFQNRQLSNLRSPSHRVADLGDDDLLQAFEKPDTLSSSHWHELFRDATRAWLTTLNDQELILLGLRWRYQLSQRESAQLLGIHEGTLSRQMDKLRERCLTEIQEQLESQGWTGDDLQDFILSEMATVLLEDSRLSMASLRQRLKKAGIKIQVPVSEPG